MSSDRRGLSRPVKVILIVLACLAGFLDHALDGWVGGITMAAAALIVPILLYRKLWGQRSFWITAMLLAVIQAPLVLAVRPLIAAARSYYMLLFVMGDGLFVIIVISLICSTSKPKDE